MKKFMNLMQDFYYGVAATVAIIAVGQSCKFYKDLKKSENE